MAYSPARTHDHISPTADFSAMLSVPEEVIHIGDSLSCDVKGASGAGIKAVWLNRSGREVPECVTAVQVLTELFPFL